MLNKISAHTQGDYAQLSYQSNQLLSSQIGVYERARAHSREHEWEFSHVCKVAGLKCEPPGLTK